MKSPLISDIQFYCLNDGPGIRTAVFVKGCPLQCEWCHNPETQSATQELYWKRALCTQCGKCMEVCPRDAINAPIDPEISKSSDSTYHKIIRENCNNCMACVDVCLYGALTTVGEEYDIDYILGEVERDLPFYKNSGGGLTITGGEPLMHAKFTTELARRASEKGINVCVDTCGQCAWELLERLAPYVDIFLYDLKHLDGAEHKKRTGVDNRRILENLRNLSAMGKRIWLRLPLIPGYNDSPEYLQRVIEFLKSLPHPVEKVDLLPFHNWCQDKYGWLGKKWEMQEVDSIDYGDCKELTQMFESQGFMVSLGS